MFGQPAGDRAQHVQLPRGERPQRLGQPARRAGHQREAGDQPPGDGRVDERVARGQAPNRADQLVGRRVLEQEPAGAGAQRLVDVLVGVEGGQDQHPGAGAERHDLPRGLEAVHLGHPDVQQRDLRGVPAHQLDRLPLARLGHHRDVGLGLQDHPEAAAA
jgi:hypothetical protein